MEQIYKELTLSNFQDQTTKLTTNELIHLDSLNREKLLELEITNKNLENKLSEWEEWFGSKHVGEEAPVQRCAVVSVEVSSEAAVQPIVLNSPSGTYLVIQRMAETHPEELRSLNTLGLNGFRKMAEKFTKENQTWHPPTTSEAWFTSGVEDIAKDPRMVANAVHTFFKN
jgi:hypothetical protein